MSETMQSINAKLAMVNEELIVKNAQLQEMLKIAEDALQYYSDKEALSYPDDWNCSKMGGPPAIEDYDLVDIGYRAREVLTRISELKGGGA